MTTTPKPPEGYVIIVPEHGYPGMVYWRPYDGWLISHYQSKTEAVEEMEKKGYTYAVPISALKEQQVSEQEEQKVYPQVGESWEDGEGYRTGPLVAHDEHGYKLFSKKIGRSYTQEGRYIKGEENIEDLVRKIPDPTKTEPIEPTNPLDTEKESRRWQAFVAAMQGDWAHANLVDSYTIDSPGREEQVKEWLKERALVYKRAADAAITVFYGEKKEGE